MSARLSGMACADHHQQARGEENAFRPETIEEIMRCMTDARDDPDIGVIVLTGSFLLPCCFQPLDSHQTTALRRALMYGSASHIADAYQ